MRSVNTTIVDRTECRTSETRIRRRTRKTISIVAERLTGLVAGFASVTLWQVFHNVRAGALPLFGLTPSTWRRVSSDSVQQLFPKTLIARGPRSVRAILLGTLRDNPTPACYNLGWPGTAGPSVLKAYIAYLPGRFRSGPAERIGSCKEAILDNPIAPTGWGVAVGPANW